LTVTAGTTAATRIMNAAGRLLPDAAWRRPAVLTAMGLVAGPLLGSGASAFTEEPPNGQHFIATPRVL
jgi:hypothetical protein